MMGERCCLEAREVRAAIGRRTVLSGVSLGVTDGEIVGLIGPNGAGKSTLMKALVGLQALSGGEVVLDGQVLGKEGLSERARRGLGYIPQGSCTLRGLSVWENLKAVPGASAEACEQMLDAVGLQALAGALGGTLSGGERRRLEIGRALLMRGLKVLLCDEPFAALDPSGVRAVAGLLRRAAQAGIGVLVTDHHIGALLGVCERVAVLVDGRVERCEASAVMQEGTWIKAYLGMDGG